MLTNDCTTFSGTITIVVLEFCQQGCAGTITVLIKINYIMLRVTSPKNFFSLFYSYRKLHITFWDGGPNKKGPFCFLSSFCTFLFGYLLFVCFFLFKHNKYLVSWRENMFNLQNLLFQSWPWLFIIDQSFSAVT